MKTEIYILLSAALLVILVLFGFLLIRYQRNKKKAIRRLESKRLGHEISILKNQMSPHFILNTINNISVLIETDPERARELLLHFGELLRYSTYNIEERKVKLSKGLGVLEKYIELQRLRLKHENAIQYRVNGSTHNKYIAPMMLLPFIENAFKHGYTATEQDPGIQIDINISSNTLQMNVKNLIKENSNHVPAEKKRGIGIENTKKRLKMIYPNEHSLNISRNNGYFTVNLEIKNLTRDAE
jgi:LytS/YehU family sensor histidine kinase